MLLTSINALVSHEMRNPLNAINGMVFKIKSVYESIKAEFRNKDNSVKQLTESIDDSLTQINDCSETLESSSKLLNFYVHDTLSLA